ISPLSWPSSSSPWFSRSVDGAKKMQAAYRTFKGGGNFDDMLRMPELRRVVLLAAALPFVASAQDAQPYRRGIDVLDYAFIIDLPDTGSVIRGDAMVTVRRTARVDTLVLDLRQLRVTRVQLEGRARQFKRTDSTI